LSQTIAVNFISVEKGINHPIPCIITDLFSNLEEKLYNEFPELRQANIYFITNGNIINRNITLEQNKIKNGSQILIYFAESSQYH